MSVLTPPPASPVPTDPSAVRLVLFGTPDAGKSSLLGALAQAAHTQGRALHGHLADLSHGLGELRNRVYDERLSETLGEIVPYPVRFAPYGKTARSAVLYDCDGRAANDLLTQKRSMEKEARAGTLAGAVLDADALILTVDASAATTQIEDDFREFVRFLRHLERYRSRQHAVGGLPVFLVLTKCDLLARDTPTRSAWHARIAERQTDVTQRFKQFLAAERVGEGGMLSFGSIHLKVRATAVRQPSLADSAPQPREPSGVAELFHHAFVEAMNFRDRRLRSHTRLLWTVGGAGGFLATMAIAGAIFLLNPSRPVEPTLADRVERLKAAEGPSAATRLGAGLDRRLEAWLEIQSHPAFPELPENLQEDVRN
ncbi:MAG TPA: GTPase domain-containing protein, partial [Gemmataceae bacterium]|nr:GTPase domain-containing protein [Gemmataceae bacterium]